MTGRWEAQQAPCPSTAWPPTNPLAEHGHTRNHQQDQQLAAQVHPNHLHDCKQEPAVSVQCFGVSVSQQQITRVRREITDHTR